MRMRRNARIEPRRFRSRRHLAECIRKGRREDGPMRNGMWFEWTDGQITGSCPLGAALIGLYGKEVLEEAYRDVDFAPSLLAEESIPASVNRDDELWELIPNKVDRENWTDTEVINYLTETDPPQMAPGQEPYTAEEQARLADLVSDAAEGDPGEGEEGTP